MAYVAEGSFLEIIKKNYSQNNNDNHLINNSIGYNDNGQI